ncbi:MAG TPA: hypothetical protein VEL05_06605 [Candidatus Acidoferrum sp.]|nr:hypothetical protein [Candidatus Acidoferrum sp.]
MKRSKNVLFAAACALAMSASACATTGNQKKVTVVECDDKAPTGSNIGRLRCYKRTDVEDRTEQDRRQMEKWQFDSMRFKAVDGSQPPADRHRNGPNQLVFRSGGTKVRSGNSTLGQ